AWRGEKSPNRQIASDDKARNEPLKLEPLPLSSAPERAEYGKALNSAKDALKQRGALSETPGRAPAPDMTITKAGVPYYSRKLLVNIKSVPKLDIGVEKSISKNDLIPPGLQVPNQKIDKFNRLATPQLLSIKELQKWTKMKKPVVSPWREPKDEFGLGRVVTINKIKKIDVNMVPENVLEAIRPLEKMTSED